MQILFIVIIFLIVLPMVVSISLAVTAKKSDERLRTICTSLEKKGRNALKKFAGFSVNNTGAAIKKTKEMIME